MKLQLTFIFLTLSLVPALRAEPHKKEFPGDCPKVFEAALSVAKEQGHEIVNSDSQAKTLVIRTKRKINRNRIRIFVSTEQKANSCEMTAQTPTYGGVSPFHATWVDEYIVEEYVTKVGKKISP
ncbi:MAG TPA: hypothetical protein VHF01_12575 [Candidatus Acidoferrum sp.]|nr:hypothetical protein [Candidatus Acidoferrum sp.]